MLQAPESYNGVWGGVGWGGGGFSFPSSIYRHVMHARHSLSIKPNTVRFPRWCVKKRGGWRGSLRITRTLIWLFDPLAWQRTKCIDSSAIAPPVSGMFFIHPAAKHSALWSFMLMNRHSWSLGKEGKSGCGEHEKAWSFKAGKGGGWVEKEVKEKGEADISTSVTGLNCRGGLRERQEEEWMKRSEVKWKTGFFFVFFPSSVGWTLTQQTSRYPSQ